MDSISAFVVAELVKKITGKVMADIEDIPVLEIIHNRLIKSLHIKEIIYVTTYLKTDDIIEDLAINLGAKCYRGHPDDVLDRIYQFRN